MDKIGASGVEDGKVCGEVVDAAAVREVADALGAGGPLPVPESAEACACVLRVVLRARKKSILGLGRIFYMAKSSLVHGEWARIWRLPKAKRPPVSKRHGDRYALIGQEFGDVNETWPSHLVNQLPVSVDALHYLAEMGRQLVLELIVDGTIHEALTADKARELRNSYRPDLNKKRPFKLDRWLGKLAAHLQHLKSEATAAEVSQALAHAATMLARCEAKRAANKTKDEFQQPHEH